MPTQGTLLLSRRHDAAQRRLADEIAALLRRRWDATVRGPGRGTDEFQAAALRDIRGQFQRSASMSRGFYTTARRLEHPGVSRYQPDAPEFSDEAVIASIVASGFHELSKALKRGDTLQKALDTAGTSVEGAGARQALSGGRQQIINAASSDRLDVGYLRTPKSGCCSFCAVLASRGKVYQKDSFDRSDPRFIGDGEVKVHDHCRCEFTPVFRRSDPNPQINQEFEDFWYAVRRSNPGLSGNDMLNAFRREYEATYLRSVGSDTSVSTEAA